MIEARPEPIIHHELLYLLFACFFLDFSLITVVNPVFPTLFEDINESWIVLLMGTDSICQTLFSTFGAGVVRNNPGEKTLKVLNVSLLVLLMTTSVYAFAIGVAEFDVWTMYCIIMVARAISGVASTIINTAGFSLCFEWHEADAHAEASGFLLSGQFLGAASGSCIGGLLGYFKEWLPFAFLSGVNVILSTIAINFARKHRKQDLNRDHEPEDDRGIAMVDGESKYEHLDDKDDGIKNLAARMREKELAYEKNYVSAHGERDEIGDEDEAGASVTGLGVYRYMHLNAVVFCTFAGSSGLTMLTLLAVYHLKNDLGLNQLLQACGLMSFEIAISAGCAVMPRLGRYVHPDKEHIWLPMFMCMGCASAATLLTAAIAITELWIFCVIVFIFGLSMAIMISFSPSIIHKAAMLHNLDIPSCMAAMDNGISGGSLFGTVVTAVLMLWWKYLEIAMLASFVLYAACAFLFLVYTFKPLKVIHKKNALLDGEMAQLGVMEVTHAML